eukprot:2970542-Alexandrium_andersonii.AAC.1
MLLAQGIAAGKGGPGCGGQCLRSPLESSLRNLSEHERREVCGNGQHIAAWGAFVMYCLSNIKAIRTEQLPALLPE